MINTWLIALETVNKVGVYLSDIAGAFDRVDSELLFSRLQNAGLGSKLCNLIKKYLSGRTGRIVVGGCFSEVFPLCNMVYQGTVLGPPLWNVFFKEVDEPIKRAGFIDARFADDLSAYRAFASSTTPNGNIMESLIACQDSVHTWGKRMRVAFDKNKSICGHS